MKEWRNEETKAKERWDPQESDRTSIGVLAVVAILKEGSLLALSSDDGAAIWDIELDSLFVLIDDDGHWWLI